MKMSEQELSKEWIELVKEAMKSYTSKEEFKKFLKEEKKKRNTTINGYGRANSANS